MMDDDTMFEPTTAVETVVYAADGSIADRQQGKVMVRPKDYEDVLPVEVRIIETTTRLISVMKIDKR